MPYEVIRLMVYTYDSVEDADQDMKHWSVPASGSAAFKKDQTIRSTIIQRPTENTNGS